MSVIAVFIYFFTITYADYMKCVEKLQYVDYDIKTVTAGDYTCTFKITAGMWKFF